MQKSEAFSILDPILLGGYTRYITDIRSKSPGLPCKPQTLANLKPTRATFFWGSMHVAWTCHTPTCISSKFVRMRQKKRCEFQTSETQSKWFPFLARTCAREMCSHRPVLATEIGELSCLGNIVSRGFWFRPKRTWTKYVLFLQCNEFVNFVRVYVGQANNVISKWPTG